MFLGNTGTFRRVRKVQHIQSSMPAHFDFMWSTRSADMAMGLLPKLIRLQDEVRFACCFHIA